MDDVLLNQAYLFVFFPRFSRRINVLHGGLRRDLTESHSHLPTSENERGYPDGGASIRPRLISGLRKQFPENSCEIERISEFRRGTTR